MNKTVGKYAMDNYTIKVPRDFGNRLVMNITICALCGGKGIIPVANQLTPFDVVIPASYQFCICPNGQSMRKLK